MLLPKTSNNDYAGIRKLQSKNKMKLKTPATLGNLVNASKTSKSNYDKSLIGISITMT